MASLMRHSKRTEQPVKADDLREVFALHNVSTQKSRLPRELVGPEATKTRRL